MALLEVKNLGISFGGLRAVNGFDISIEKDSSVRPDRSERRGKDDCIQPSYRSI